MIRSDLYRLKPPPRKAQPNNVIGIVPSAKAKVRARSEEVVRPAIADQAEAIQEAMPVRRSNKKNRGDDKG